MHSITFNQFFHWHLSLCPDSIGSKLGGKPGGKKPFKPYNSTERKGRLGKGGDSGKNQHKFAFSKAGNGQQKRKLPPFKGKNKEEEGEGEKTSTCQFLSLHNLSDYNVLLHISVS